MRKVFILIRDLDKDKLSGTQLRDYLYKMIEVVKMIDHEEFEGFLEMGKFNGLFSMVKTSDSDYRNILELRRHFSEWSDFSELDDRIENVRVGQQDFKSHIYGACAACSDELVINHDAYPGNTIRINIFDGPLWVDVRVIEMLPCDDVKVYEWFNDNRDPERKFDGNYLKHSRFDYRIVNNKKVSPLTIEEDLLMECLKKSVGCKDERRIYFYDRKLKLLLVFYDENTNNQYHGHEILPEDKKKEEAKIDNEIVRKMKKVFKYKRG